MHSLTRMFVLQPLHLDNDTIFMAVVFCFGHFYIVQQTVVQPFKTQWVRNRDWAWHFYLCFLVFGNFCLCFLVFQSSSSIWGTLIVYDRQLLISPLQSFMIFPLFVYTQWIPYMAPEDCQLCVFNHHKDQQRTNSIFFKLLPRSHLSFSFIFLL